MQIRNTLKTYLYSLITTFYPQMHWWPIAHFLYCDKTACLTWCQECQHLQTPMRLISHPKLMLSLEVTIEEQGTPFFFLTLVKYRHLYSSESASFYFQLFRHSGSLHQVSIFRRQLYLPVPAVMTVCSHQEEYIRRKTFLLR